MSQPLSRVALGVTLLILVTGQGCVRRRLTIRSNPPGAIVYVDDQRIGNTPVSTEFIYYGTRKLRLVKDGYETVSTLQTVKAPWYQIPPIDFVSENLIARELRDERILEFQMQPQRLVPTQELLTRANNLRTSATQGVVAPLPGGP
ncbi:MAG TPA: PEGA domain-containing protein [Pirellulaceae bacterium]